MLTGSQRWFFLVVSLVLCGSVYLLAPILTPFLAGALLAYLSDPMADRLENWGCSRTTSVVIVFAFLTVLMTAVFLLFLPNLGRQIQVLVQQIPEVFQLVESRFLPWLQVNLGIDPAAIDVNMLKQLILKDWQKTGDIMAQIAAGITRSGLALAGWVTDIHLLSAYAIAAFIVAHVYLLTVGHSFRAHVKPMITGFEKVTLTPEEEAYLESDEPERIRPRT